MKKIILLFCITVFASSSHFLWAQVQSPSEFFEEEYGTRMPLYHDIIRYFDYLEAESDFVHRIPYGSTYEGRSLTLYVLSSPENLNNLNEIQSTHKEYLGGNGSGDMLIYWMSYGVHGNEVGATTAAPLTAYEILSKHKEKLNEAVVILDPVVNPDGFARYTQWYNQYKSLPAQSATSAIEHDEPWPSGRVNHYLFDLNRDLSWLTQKESVARIQAYQNWLPHIHIDFHEQFPENPYYFAPAAEPIHPLMSEWQREFQDSIGKYNTAEFDRNNWAYFTKEYFDLFYPGYGDTYPLFYGSIGMTYEQAGHGIAGLAYETQNGDTLFLKERIEHHTASGLRTFLTAYQYREDLKVEMRDFYSPKENSEYSAYLLTNLKESELSEIQEFFKHHGIETEAFNNAVGFQGYSFSAEEEVEYQTQKNSLLIPVDQFAGTFIEVLFQEESKLSTPITYDITAWALPFAWNVEVYGLENTERLSERRYEQNKLQVTPEKISRVRAIALKGNSIETHRLLAAINGQNFPVRIASGNSVYGKSAVSRGDYILLRADYGEKWNELFPLLSEASAESVEFIYSGYADNGVDLGSDSYSLIEMPDVVTIFDENVSPNSVGFIWHYFEQELEMPLHRLERKQVFDKLDEFNTLVLTDGDYTLDESELETLDSWLNGGGKLIVLGDVNAQFAKNENYALSMKTTDSEEKEDELSPSDIEPYAKATAVDSSRHNPGSVIRTRIDDTHPLAYGMGENYFSLTTSSQAYELSDKLWNIAYTQEDFSHYGYMGSEVKENLEGSLIIGVEDKGAGHVIYFHDDPLFRGFWKSGKQLMGNALFNF